MMARAYVYMYMFTSRYFALEKHKDLIFNLKCFKLYIYMLEFTDRIFLRNLILFCFKEVEGNVIEAILEELAYV